MRRLVPHVVAVKTMRQLVLRMRQILRDVRIRADVLYPNLATLVDRYAEASVGLTGYELKVFSQNGEDGVIAEILRRIGSTTRTFVEFGVGTGVEGNCVFLADVMGWHGTFIEGSNDLHAQLAAKYAANDAVVTLHDMVTAENINEILAAGRHERTVDVLSIDIDGNDYWVWQAINAIDSRLVVIEYNGSIDPRNPLVQPYRPSAGWDGTGFFGASLAAMIQLGREKGYTFVHSELTGVNAFFVKDELTQRLSDVGPPPLRSANYSLQGMSHVPGPTSSRYLSLGRDPT